MWSIIDVSNLEIREWKSNYEWKLITSAERFKNKHFVHWILNNRELTEKVNIIWLLIEKYFDDFLLYYGIDRNITIARKMLKPFWWIKIKEDESSHYKIWDIIEITSETDYIFTAVIHEFIHSLSNSSLRYNLKNDKHLIKSWISRRNWNSKLNYTDLLNEWVTDIISQMFFNFIKKREEKLFNKYWENKYWEVYSNEIWIINRLIIDIEESKLLEKENILNDLIKSYFLWDIKYFLNFLQ